MCELLELGVFSRVPLRCPAVPYGSTAAHADFGSAHVLPGTAFGCCLSRHRQPRLGPQGCMAACRVGGRGVCAKACMAACTQLVGHESIHTPSEADPLESLARVRVLSCRTPFPPRRPHQAVPTCPRSTRPTSSEEWARRTPQTVEPWWRRREQWCQQAWQRWRLWRRRRR